MWRGERIIRRVVRQGSRDQLLLRLHMAGQREVLAGLRAYALGKQFEKWRGWAYYAFLEIFGTKPRWQDEQVEPGATPELLDLITEWAAGRK